MCCVPRKMLTYSDEFLTHLLFFTSLQTEGELEPVGRLTKNWWRWTKWFLLPLLLFKWIWLLFKLALHSNFIAFTSHLDGKHNECHKDHDDHQELRGPDLRGDIAEPHCGEGDHAEIEWVEQGQVVARSLEVLNAANADERIRKRSGHRWDRDFTPKP